MEVLESDIDSNTFISSHYCYCQSMYIVPPSTFYPKGAAIPSFSCLCTRSHNSPLLIKLTLHFYLKCGVIKDHTHCLAEVGTCDLTDYLR